MEINRTRLPILLLTLAGFLSPGSASQAATPIAIENCHVISMVDERILQNHTVVVVDGKIATIAPANKAAIPDNATRVNGTGKYLIPGLADAHVHIGHETELISYLRHGVTTVFNLGGDYIDLFNNERMAILALREKVARNALPGPTIFTSGQSLDGDPPTGPFQRSLASAEAAKAAVLEQKKAGYDFIKVYDSLSSDLHRAIVAEARKAGLAVFGHIPEAVGVDGTLTSGQTVIAHAEEFYPVFEDVADLRTRIKRLAENVGRSGVYVIPNTAFIRRLIFQLEDLETQLARPEVRYLAPRVRVWWEPRYNYYVNRDNADQFLKDTRRKYNWLLPLAGELHRQGVTLLLGTDASIPAALPGLSVHDELDDLVKAGLTPYEAMRTATANIETFAAKYLSRHPRFGTIQVGHRADLVLVSKNPLTSVSNLRAIEGVMTRGQWYTAAALTKLLEKKTAGFDE